MKRYLEFRECDTCRAKPGALALCSGCLHNRDVIEAWNLATKNNGLKARLRAFKELNTQVKR